MADTGYTPEEMQLWQEEGETYNVIAKESPEQTAVREKMRARAQQPSNMAALQGQLAQSQLARQAARAAYAQGYNPAAVRASLEAQADAQMVISHDVQRVQQEDSDRSLQAYGQLLQQRQKMSLAAEEAKRAYVMGNQKMALQQLDNVRRAEVSAKGVQMMEANAKRDASDRMTSALIGGAATLGATYFGRTPTQGQPQDVTPIVGQNLMKQASPAHAGLMNYQQQPTGVALLARPT